MQNDLIDGLINEGEKYNKYKYFQSLENSDVLDCKKEKVFNEQTKECTIKYKVKAKKDCNIYIASDYDLQVYINNEPVFKNYSNIWSTETGIKQIKSLKQEEELEFTVVTKQNLDLLYIYVSDNEEIQKVLDKKESLTNVQIKKNGLTGKTNFKEDGYLVFGIAYDKCWKIYIDGKETKTESIAGCFLGVKLEKGVHYIETKANYKTITKY